MSTSQETARTVSEGGYVDLESPLWPDSGVEPSETADYAYAAYDEPAAGLDNGINHKITYDHGQLNLGLGDLDARVSALEDDVAQLRTDLDNLESSFSSHNHDSRYYKQSSADDRFVDVAGDTMTGDLAFDRIGTTSGYIDATGETSTFSMAVQDGNGRASQYWNAEPGSQDIIAEDEGAAWWFMDGGTAHLSLYDGDVGDVGTTPNWSQVFSANTGGVTFGSGASFGSAANFNGNQAVGISKATFTTSGNDFMTVSDGSGGSNEDPLTLNYSGRGLRFYAGDTSTSSLTLGTGGSARFAGDVSIDTSGSTLSLGTGGGPHALEFGNDSNNGGLRFVMRTAPNRLTVEQPDGTALWHTDQDTNIANFGNTSCVVLPVRGGAPSTRPSGATWIET